MIAPPQENPIAEGVQAWERDISRANLQGNNPVKERDAQRHDGQEDHRQRVHREQLAEHIGADERGVRRGQLDSHEAGFKAADKEEEAGRDKVKRADLLVIDRREPAPDTVSTGWSLEEAR